ncbi:hypothetical protein SS05631_c40190 [Sinorhizobium sp. CCBAU 05631]|nr:hypothetical protein SS05631_c40190 [Sinorhizobium sp. CCBAU 05631]
MRRAFNPPVPSGTGCEEGTQRNESLLLASGEKVAAAG